MFITRDGIKLYYEITGSGPPLILLHGNGEDHFIFDNIIEGLGKMFTVYSLDTRGHGQSGSVKEFHYQDMADDVVHVIQTLGLERPILYGFSDGGIIGLLIAYQHPRLLSRLIASGANLEPEGLKTIFYWGFRILNFFMKDPKLQLLLTEPAITPSDLERIEIPVHIIAGKRDMVREAHTRSIAHGIANSQLRILPGETHSSYVVHCSKLLDMIKEATE